MIVPPTIRLGIPSLDGNYKTEYVLLLKPTGWTICKFNYTNGYFYDANAHPHVRADYVIDPERILCWMPQDGS